MIRPITFWAQSDNGTGTTADFTVDGFFDSLNMLHDPTALLSQLEKLPIIAAAVIVTLGVLCVFNGYRWHKWVVALLALAAGIGLGLILSQQMGRPMIIAVSVGLLFAMVATPLLRISVALFGGLTGAFIGSNIWTAVNDASVDHHWAGAVIGFIVIAMLSLVLFRLVVVLFTSVGGSVMVICGGITLLMGVPTWREAVRDSFTSTPLLLPLLLALGAVGGFILQESRLRADGVKILGVEGKAT